MNRGVVQDRMVILCQATIAKPICNGHAGRNHTRTKADPSTKALFMETTSDVFLSRPVVTRARRTTILTADITIHSIPLISA